MRDDRTQHNRGVNDAIDSIRPRGGVGFPVSSDVKTLCLSHTASLPRCSHTMDLHLPCSSVQITLLHGVTPTYDGTVHLFKFTRGIKRKESTCQCPCQRQRRSIHHPSIHPFIHSRSTELEISSLSSAKPPSFPQNLNHIQYAAFRTSPCSRRYGQRHAKATRLGLVQPLPAKDSEPYVRPLPTPKIRTRTHTHTLFTSRHESQQ